MSNKKNDLIKEVEKLEGQIKQIKYSLDDMVKVVKGEDGARIKTFIEGFDEALGGGIRERHIVLISGTSGTLKSSLALSVLYNNLKNQGSKGLYLSLEESKESLLETMQGLNLGDFDEKELMIVDIGRMRIEHEEVNEEKNWFGIIEEYLKRKVLNENISLLVLDSLTALSSMSKPDNLRNELFQFFNFLKGLGVTTFLITESSGNSDNGLSARNTEEYLSDGLINLNFVERNGTIELRIRCVKLRHSEHSPNYFILDTSNGRFVARPANGYSVNKEP
jgi:non-specific serine/threonine protein kinase